MLRTIPFAFRFCVFTMLALLWGIGCAQTGQPALKWPEITQASKPWSRWWWQGNSVTKAGITAELEAYQKAGLGGLELTPIYGVIGEEDQFVDYLSPKWMDMFEHTLQEARRLGLGIDMATGTGWPFGGPWVSESDACKYMAHKEYKLKGGQRLAEPIRFIQEPILRAVPNQVYQSYGIYKEKGEKVTGSMQEPETLANRPRLEIGDLVEPISANKNLQALALDQVRFEKQLPLQTLMAYSDDGVMLNLTNQVDANGTLNWTAPQGNWTLYAVFQGWHGKMVERAAPGGEGNVIDHFSATAIRNYLHKFDQAFEGRKTQGLRAFFNDSYEVDDARGQADWTPDLFEAFLTWRGYDLRNHLPALFGEDSEEQNIRVRSDYRETVSDLLLETFTKEWAAWARKKGAIVRNQAHGSPASILDLYAASDIPETEGTDIVRMKFASSAAHVTGKRLASSESATWLNEHFLSNLSAIKQSLDRYLAGGINHVFYHGTCYSPPGEAWPGRLFYAAVHANPRNSLWPDFSALNQYVARTQAFLQAGEPDNDILIYFPVYDRFASERPEMLEHFDGSGKGADSADVRSVADTLQAGGYSYDFVSDRQVGALAVENGKLTTGGNTYRIILIPETRFMPLPTMEKLLELAKKGATIVFHTGLPADVPGLPELEKRRERLQQITASLNPGISGMATVGAGRSIVAPALSEALGRAGVSREALVDQGLQFTRRRYEHGNYFFLSNWSESDLDGWVPLQGACKAVAIFDPMTGQSGFAQTRKAAAGNGTVELRLQLNRGASCILKTFDAETKGEPWIYIQRSGDPVPVTGAWKLEFVQGGPELPAPAEIATLGSWTGLGGEAVKRFSGTARYSIQLPRPGGEGRGWLLDLGLVAESARVRLNGREIGVALGPVYQLFVDRNLVKANNLLEIEVSNLMANRIAGMDRDGTFWKKFYNVNFPARKSENRGKNGLFDASGWEPRPSGLIGPVTLTLLK